MSFLFNIYAGLGGSFGGATYRGTGEFKSYADAENEAYELAVEEYQSYEGYHGILSWHDVADENVLDYNEDSAEIDELYVEEMESWLDYYAVLASEDEDTLEEDRFEI